MKPGTFCLENALTMLSDARRRVLGDEARQYAQEGKPAREMPTTRGAGTHWDAVIAEHESIFWLDAYQKRCARIKRMGAR